MEKDTLKPTTKRGRLGGFIPIVRYLHGQATIWKETHQSGEFITKADALSFAQSRVNEHKAGHGFEDPNWKINETKPLFIFH